nr:unnamed protein product [Callosobruchus chinensis]
MNCGNMMQRLWRTSKEHLPTSYLMLIWEYTLLHPHHTMLTFKHPFHMLRLLSHQVLQMTV